ncbi:hypothetical protein SNOG_02435 [Parastagonospora nodorum SN15]|uniref:Uncharacterized protein n=1 Tax=Phaeosphaeria nodorum (strain SN15 / ATCC MYA-4574 / FGSC 10173) TaxID=321614 RepID=Q0V0M9_PHANO|nr:hypothetical protein SNOG_02435 [Parastagonospora nodorum SN15]EAT90647.1 hypothetical protein SNOG_02435 [Parastagonospora nodorum SN15]
MHLWRPPSSSRRVRHRSAVPDAHEGPAHQYVPKEEDRTPRAKSPKILN